MKKILRIPLLAIVTMAIGFFTLDLIFPGSVTEMFLLETLPTEKLIKSGNPVFCELGVEKIKSLSPKEKTELKAFLVQEFTAGPSQVRRTERMSILYGANSMISLEPVEHCLFKVVMSMVAEIPELLPLLARPDNFKGYSRHLTLEVLEKYILNSPETISHFTNYLKEDQSSEGSLAAALFESAGENGTEIVLSQLIRLLNNSEVKSESRQILFYWSLVEKSLRKSAKEKSYPSQVLSVIRHPNLEKQLGVAMARSLVSVYGYNHLPSEVVALASSNLDPEPPVFGGTPLFYSSYDLRTALLEALEKRSWDWISADDFPSSDREIFLNYFKEVQKDLKVRYQHLVDLRIQIKNYPDEKPEFSFSTELKIILENPQFPKNLKNQFLNYISKNSQVILTDPFDRFVASEYARLETAQKDRNSNKNNFEVEFFKKHLYVSFEMYFLVFKNLFESPDIDRTQGNQQNNNEKAEALTTFLELMRSPASRRIVQAYFSFRRDKSTNTMTFAYKSLGGGEEEFFNHITSEFKCDHTTYVSFVYFVPLEKSQDLLQRLLGCSTDFLASRRKWHGFINLETLATTIEKENDEKKKVFLLGLYENFQQVKF